MAEKYFVLSSGEDGIDIREFSEAELLKALTPDEDGYQEVGPEFLKRVPEIDKGCWYQADDPEAVLIIKGKIIVPQSKKFATKYEL